MINSTISYCLMILVIIITSISVISTLSIAQKVMAHILPSEEAKVIGDDQVNVRSSIPYQLLLVMAVTAAITVIVARVQIKCCFKGLLKPKIHCIGKTSIVFKEQRDDYDWNSERLTVV